MGDVAAARMAKSAGLLLGRRSYEDMLSHWNTEQPDSPFTHGLNVASKYVVSTCLAEPLPWPNSTLLTGDIVAAVRELKARPGGDCTPWAAACSSRRSCVTISSTSTC